MKRTILTIGLAASLLLAKAQQGAVRVESFKDKLSALSAIEDQKELKNRLSILSNSKSEDDHFLAIEYYKSKGEEEKAEALNKKSIKQFPQGNLAFQQRLAAFQELTGLEERDQAFQKLRAEFPNQSYYMIGSMMASEYAAAGNDAKMKEYIDSYAESLSDGRGNKIDKRTLYGQVATGLIAKNPDAAVKYLKMAVDYAKESMDEINTPSHPRYNLLARAQGNYYGAMTSYLGALTRGSNPEEAYKQSLALYNEVKDGENANAITLAESAYTNALITTKRYKEAFPFIEKAIRSGTASSVVKENLKNAYIAKNGSEMGYLEFEKAVNAERDALALKEVLKKAISKEAPTFELKDVDGHTVNLADLRGKVVVLDFWATWCGPCKASFPAMQKAVNKYKEDQGVKFLFLHTWEKGSGDATVGAKKYIVDNNYSFEVLMDLRNPETTESAVAKAYGVSGIPTKVVIDPKGQIRFVTSGFSADEEKAVNELSTMIEFARK